MITSRESEWDDTDRGIIYALLDYQSDLCPGCGQPMTDTLHKEGEPDPPFTASYAVCTACVAKERVFRIQNQRDEKIEKTGGVVYRDSRRWLLIRPQS